MSDKYFAEKYGDPDWGKMKPVDYPGVVADAIKRFPQHTLQQLLNVVMTESHGRANPNAAADEIRRQIA